jgi:hypothetical protein
MDDYSISTLTESNNEWCSRVVHILTPLIIDGIKSIFDEAWKLCKENNELDKYLMTFQNFITRVPKWNSNLIQEETARICEKSNCGYLEDLITCVHIIKLKSLTCIRVGQKQKKIDINVPPLNEFIHKIYINVARKLYSNVYLFERNIPPLQVQKNNRELELIVKECILLTIRDSIPVESILRTYMDETQETCVEVEEKEEIVEKEIINDNDDKSNNNLQSKNVNVSNNEFKGGDNENNTSNNVKFNESLNTVKEIDNISDTLNDLIINTEETINNKKPITLDFTTNNTNNNSSDITSQLNNKVKISGDDLFEPLELDELTSDNDEHSDVDIEFDEL